MMSSDPYDVIKPAIFVAGSFILVLLFHYFTIFAESQKYAVVMGMSNEDERQ